MQCPKGLTLVRKYDDPPPWTPERCAKEGGKWIPANPKAGPAGQYAICITPPVRVGTPVKPYPVPHYADKCVRCAEIKDIKAFDAVARSGPKNYKGGEQCIGASGEFLGIVLGSSGPKLCTAIAKTCPPCAVALGPRGVNDCDSPCLDSDGNEIGRGHQLNPSQIACVKKPKPGSEAAPKPGPEVAPKSGLPYMPPTISPEPTVEGGFDGGSRPDVAAAEKPWYTKPVLGVPVGVAVALGIAGLVLWRRKGGGAKKMAYSRRKARRLTRR